MENRKRGFQSKLAKNDLEDTAMTLLTAIPKLTYQEICDELNAMAGLEGTEAITVDNITHFAKNVPEVRKEVMLANRQHLRKFVFESAEFNMLGYLKEMTARTMFMLETLEEENLANGTIMSPKDYKALNSELRETLKQIEGIHKEIYQMEVVREFLLEVVKTLKEVSPEALPTFIAKMKGKRENSHMVNELLQGGFK